MRTAPPVVAFCLILLAAHPTTAQDPDPVPQLDRQQRWVRAVSNLNAFALALLHLGREYGESPEEVGTRVGTFFGPSWGGRPGTTTPEQVARGMAANLQLWPGAVVSVTALSDGGARLRYNRPWSSWFQQVGATYDFTIDDFEAYFNAAMVALGDYLGLAVEARRDGEEWVLTIRDG